MKISQIKPLFDNVLVEPLQAEDKLPSGILLPDTAKEKPQMGMVIATGPGTTNDKGQTVKMLVKKGDKILYKKWGGNEIKIQGKEYLVVEQKDVIAVII